MTNYHYVECGLKNVWVDGLIVMDDAGDEVLCIRHVERLHRVIAEAIIAKPGLTGQEVRFLRSEMGMTQAELGEVLHKEGLTVGRWERGEHPIDENAVTVIRLLAIEKLGLKTPSITEVASLSVNTAIEQPITIDGNDPSHYKVAA